MLEGLPCLVLDAMMVSSSGAPPITRERLFQLSRLIGQTPADANTKREGDGIVEFSVGEN